MHLYKHTGRIMADEDTICTICILSQLSRRGTWPEFFSVPP